MKRQLFPSLGVEIKLKQMILTSSESRPPPPMEPNTRPPASAAERKKRNLTYNLLQVFFYVWFWKLLLRAA